MARQEGSGGESGGESEVDESEAGEGEKGQEEEPQHKKVGSSEKRLRNQFNFSERASQTLNNPYRVMLRDAIALTLSCNLLGQRYSN